MKRILIVDDKEENLHLLRVLLEGHGLRVEAASNGSDALEQARRSPPHLIISDLLMPLLDGYSLLRLWKNDPVLAPVPFVVYTATYLETEDEELAVNLGADDFIAKPTEPDEFLARIRKVLERSTSQGSSSPRLAQGEEPDLIRRHADSLIRKLDEKTAALEAANATLREDVRRREAAEASLRQSEWLQRLAGKAARLGGWSLDLATQRLSWTDQVCEIHEVPPGTVPEVSWAIQFYAPEYRDEVRNCIEACKQDGAPFDEELQIVTARGRRIWVRSIGYAERDENGRIARIQGAFQDIDDRHRLETQYRQSQKMEVVGRLAGGVAHDFNNLLTVINGYADLALDELEPGHPAREMIVTIRQAGERSAGLTRQLLAFSRQEVSIPRLLDINDVLRDLDRLLRRIIGEDVTLEVRPGNQVGTVRIDPGQLEQVVMNLSVNARDAMPDGGKLLIETSRVEIDSSLVNEQSYSRPGPHVMLSVSDTGTGMPAEIREKIFEPFFTTKPAGRGTGLGLSVVHGVVKQNGGHIEVLSEPGVGSTFQIFWPVVGAVTEVTDAGASPAAMPRGTEKVLLVEDDHMVRYFARTVLHQCGYDVLETSDTNQALRILQEHEGRIQALVTDVIMPGMGGRQLSEEARRSCPAIRVLYISGYTPDAMVRQGIHHDGINFLQKPFTAQDLAQKLRRLLDSALDRAEDVAGACSPS